MKTIAVRTVGSTLRLLCQRSSRMLWTMIGMLLVAAALPLIAQPSAFSSAGGLVGHWSFDDGSGPVAADSSGYGNHGRLLDGPHWQTAQLRPGALLLDGLFANMNVGNSPALNPSDEITLAAWIAPYDLQIYNRALSQNEIFQTSNDNFADGFDLPRITTANNFNATREPGEPDHNPKGRPLSGHSVWWHWTAPNDGNVVLSTLGSSFDTVLALYTGSTVDRLFTEGLNDNWNLTNSWSQVLLFATAGTTYHVAVDGIVGEWGDVQPSARYDALPAVNLICPHDGDTFPSGTPIDLGATASDSDGFVTAVTFVIDDLDLIRVNLVDDTRPYLVSWTPPKPGQYHIYAFAEDNDGWIGESVPTEVIVSVPGGPPIVSVTGPPDGAAFIAPASLPVRVTAAGADSQATDNNGPVSINKVPAQPNLIAPADGSTSVASIPLLCVQVSNAEASNLTVTFFGRDATARTSRPDFSIITLSDTQTYVGFLNGGTPSMFTAQTDWIVTNRAVSNIVFVAHLGDSVQNGDNLGNNVEWLYVTNAMYRLEDPLTTSLSEGIPYGVCVGNHDETPLGSAVGTTIFYNQFFGSAHFAGRSYYGGHYGNNNNNHFQLFSASGMDFIVLNLEYDLAADPAVLNWANLLLQAYPNRRAIVISHYLMNPGYYGSFGPQGQAIYDALKPSRNLFLMLTGHVPCQEGFRRDTFNGNTITTLLSDYQERANGGDGWLRIYQFSPSNNVIHARTYSPWLQAYESDSDSEFTIDYDMTGAQSTFTMIGVTNLSSSANATLAWNNVSAAAHYEWYVTVSDGTNSITGPEWSFNTANALPPVVSIVTPTNATTAFLPGSVSINALASASGGVIGKVELYTDETLFDTQTSAPYTFSWSNPTLGRHLLTAVAEDQLGRRATSAPVQISLVSNFTPTISITNPVYGASFTAPATVTVAATATDSDGAIARVEFFADGTLIGTETSSPYRFTWNNVGVGSYLLSARATDNSGSITTSNPIDITVDNGSQLAGYWKFDEGVSTLAVDSSGRGNTGTLLGGATWTTGRAGGGLDLDGIDGYVELGNNSSLNPVGQLTICAWIKPASFVTTGQIVAKDRCMSDQYYFRVQAGGKLRFGIDADLINGATTLALDTWQWVAATYDGSEMKIYVNGVLDVARSKKGRMRDNGSGARIGNRASTSSSLSFKGVIDEVRIYNRALSQPQLQELINASPVVSLDNPSNGSVFSAPATIRLDATASDSDGTIAKVQFFDGAILLATVLSPPYSFDWNNASAGTHTLTARATDDLGAVTISPASTITVNDTGAALAGYWRFDEGTGTTANDASGNGNHGTLVNGPTWAVGQSGGALSFDGVNDYVDAGNGAALNPAGELTLLAWINPAQLAASAVILAKDNSGVSQYFLRVQGGGKLRFGIGTTFVNGFTTLPLNTWALVAATYDGSQMKLYVNGNVDGSVARTGTMSNNGGNVRIGARQFTTVLPFNGRIDEARLYNRALTQAEIEAILTPPSNAPPTASLTAPPNNAVFTSPANITLEATASDSDGTIAKVEFFDGTDLLAIVLNAPYTFVWNNAPAGAHTLIAKATDDGGGTGTSTSVNLTITSGAVDPSLISYWKFDEGAGTVAGDASGSDNPGSLLNGTIWAAGHAGSAVSFDGIDDYVRATPKIATATNCTVAAWFKTSSTAVEDIYSEGSSTDGTPLLRIVVNRFGVGTIGFEHRDNANLLNSAYVAVNANNGVWHHVALVRTAANAWTVYFDGAIVAAPSGTTAGAMTVNCAAIGSLLRTTPSSYFQGLIDEVRLYNRALSQAEVRGIMQ